MGTIALRRSAKAAQGKEVARHLLAAKESVLAALAVESEPGACALYARKIDRLLEVERILQIIHWEVAGDVEIREGEEAAA